MCGGSLNGSGRHRDGAKGVALKGIQLGAEAAQLFVEGTRLQLFLEVRTPARVHHCAGKQCLKVILRSIHVQTILVY